MTDFVIAAPAQIAVPVSGGGLFPVRRVFCVGRNYAAHAREMGSDPDREPPFFFCKPADAVVTSGEPILIERGIAIRYVVANPSSYVYFDELRPSAAETFEPSDATRCPHFNDWKYGLVNAPAYAKLGVDGISATTLEAAYARRDVVTLLGGDDCDPLHPALDTSCAANAQGRHRLERGRAYTRYMQMRHADALQHRHFEIPGVGHDGTGIFTSAHGLSALFDVEAHSGATTQT